MSESKSGPTPTGRRALSDAATRTARSMSPQPDEEMRRLLREAAWRRMFGNTGVKNPFIRRGG